MFPLVSYCEVLRLWMYWKYIFGQQFIALFGIPPLSCVCYFFTTVIVWEKKVLDFHSSYCLCIIFSAAPRKQIQPQLSVRSLSACLSGFSYWHYKLFWWSCLIIWSCNEWVPWRPYSDNKLTVGGIFCESRMSHTNDTAEEKLQWNFSEVAWGFYVFILSWEK